MACAVVAACSLASGVWAEDRVWLIGGGYDLASSQVQIEHNMLFIREVVLAQPATPTLQVFFTDGQAPGRGVVEWQPPEETAEALQPFAGVMNNSLENGDRYRGHRIPDVAGTTDASALLPALACEEGSL